MNAPNASIASGLYRHQGEGIEFLQRHRVGDATAEISEFEYGYVLANPNLYYFTQTVNVHDRMAMT